MSSIQGTFIGSQQDVPVVDGATVDIPIYNLREGQTIQMVSVSAKTGNRPIEGRLVLRNQQSGSSIFEFELDNGRIHDPGKGASEDYLQWEGKFTNTTNFSLELAFIAKNFSGEDCLVRVSYG